MCNPVCIKRPSMQWLFFCAFIRLISSTYLGLPYTDITFLTDIKRFLTLKFLQKGVYSGLPLYVPEIPEYFLNFLIHSNRIFLQHL